ncbi:MAG: hypothetical protein SAK29_11605 [Scytonema sp. PMC 1069.18]|nr:hypothetical protein [Scytonema sp. PMC 1069.18]MEC4887275.1 hypothetical protein [Scytonema sp. PMC 1070.18]
MTKQESWKFQRHGVGIYFIGSQSGKVVDVHLGVFKHPKAFDAWRLVQYFESIGIQNIVYCSKIFNFTEEEQIESLLNCILQDNLIEKVVETQKLYTLNKCLSPEKKLYVAERKYL